LLFLDPGLQVVCFNFLVEFDTTFSAWQLCWGNYSHRIHKHALEPSGNFVVCLCMFLFTVCLCVFSTPVSPGECVNNAIPLHNTV